MNPLDLLADEHVSDVMVDSDKPIWIEKNGELQETSHHFASEVACRDFTRHLIQEHDSRIDLAKPFAEINLNSEFGLVRVHALLGGECSFGTQLSIRRHPQDFYTIQDLQKLNFISEGQLPVLQEIIRLKKNFVIVGATGSGKTTLLRAMLMEITKERLIVIEESSELRVPGSVELFTRISNQEGVGEIGLAELAKQALRMRPDRLVLGEARGQEVAVLLQALNTGHSGAGFTLHANGISETVPRLLTLLAQQNIQPSLGRMMIGSAVEVVIEVIKSPDRQVASIETLVI
ncbi:MAG: ATPase [Micrococcales bacterium]|nr:ATPase [Micrococcales bacterium]